jgi:pimeloyl-ACP methyl ester carboxylesterase
MASVTPRPTWILIRGLARESAHWGPFLPALRESMADADVVALDLPGTGTRLHDRSPGTIGAMVEALRDEAATRLPAGTPRMLFGISLGGMVAMEWAARHPDELTCIVVAASSATDLAPFWRRFTPRGLATVVRNARTRDPLRRQARLARLLMSRRDLRDEAARQWAQIERDRPVSRATLLAQITAAARWRAPSSLPVPSLFLVGRGDRLVHPDCSRTLAKRYGAPLSEHRSAGHDLTTDEPAWVVDEVVRFRRGL